MSKDFSKVESALDKKLQLRHLPITKVIDNFVLRVGEVFQLAVGNFSCRYYS
jgi:hypothetical protein